MINVFAAEGGYQEFTLRNVDKLWLIQVRRDDASLVLIGRELDAETGRLGPTYRRPVPVAVDLPRVGASAILAHVETTSHHGIRGSRCGWRFMKSVWAASPQQRARRPARRSCPIPGPPDPMPGHPGDMPKAAKDWPNHVIRDAAYLNWRYLQSPRDYVAVAGGGSYAVVGHKEHRGTALAYVADLVGHPGFLLRACLADVRPGARALIAIPAPEHRATYAAMGFFPTRTKLHFMGKALAGELDINLRSWRFTLGDTDFF